MKKKTKKKLGAVALKHKLVLDKLKENMGNNGKKASIKQAMIDAGYSESYAENGDIKNTKTWEEIMQEELPDALLAEKHKALLEKQEVIVRNNVSTKEIEVIPTGQIDVIAVKSGLDMAYKLKKRYDNTINVKGTFAKLSDAELEEAIAREISEALGAIAGENQEDNS